MLELRFPELNTVVTLRDGVRPYVEVWQGEHRMLSTLQEYERLKLYFPTDNKVNAVPSYDLCSVLPVLLGKNIFQCGMLYRTLF